MPKSNTDGARTLAGSQASDDREYDITLRPSRFDDFIGQTKLKENLRVYVEAAKRFFGLDAIQSPPAIPAEPTRVRGEGGGAAPVTALKQSDPSGEPEPKRA